ncbi:MAG: type II toxin-antitoxin system VapC family toxin [bacterium]|nr:type II toxin-antitoxin system VapC family toxin [bacterium]
MILTDTCVIIEYVKNNPIVALTFRETGKREFVLNSIIVMELLAGARNKVELNSL